MTNAERRRFKLQRYLDRLEKLDELTEQVEALRAELDERDDERDVLVRIKYRLHDLLYLNKPSPGALDVLRDVEKVLP
jgi:hypothetical protein